MTVVAPGARRTPALSLRSVRRRPATALGLFLIVLVAAASAAAGPILVRAAEQSGLRAELARAAPGGYDITVSADADGNLVPDVISAVTLSAQAATPVLFDQPLIVVRTQNRKLWRVSGGPVHAGYGASIAMPAARASSSPQAAARHDAARSCYPTDAARIGERVTSFIAAGGSPSAAHIDRDRCRRG